MRTKVLIMVTLLMFGCSKPDLENYQYFPYPQIEVNFQLKAINYDYTYKYNSIDFILEIDNYSEGEYLLNIGQIQAEINGIMTDGTYYNSYGSVTPKLEKLKKGNSVNDLYFSIKGNEKFRTIEKFDIVNFGIVAK